MSLQNVNAHEIARALGRPTSTMICELQRNTGPQAGYESLAAQTVHAARSGAARPTPKLE